MKKKRDAEYPDHWVSLKKIFLVMKLMCVLVVFLTFQLSAVTYAQKKVTLNFENVSMLEVIQELRSQTGYKFFFNHNELKKVTPVTAQFEEEELEQVLHSVLNQSNLSFRVEQGIIIITPVKAPQEREIVISGRITDTGGLPLVGVTVRVEGLSLGTSSDKNGNYTFTLSGVERFSLVFSFIGMETQKIAYTGQEFIHVVMRESTQELDEFVVSTGYQRIDLRKTTSAIQSIKAEDIVVPGLSSIDQMLEGHIPGMIFMQNSGQIGVAPRLRIRGTSTILGNQEPLWVIDGIVQENPVNISPDQINDLDFVNLLGNAITGLNPNDVEQIDILKDASATALYGARAANGVIVVTTKQGRPGPPSLSYSFSGTFRQRPRYSDASVNMMDSRERIDFSRELIEKNVTYPLLTNGWVGYEKAIRDFWLGRISYEDMQAEVSHYESVNTDWFDVLMQNSFSHKHTLGLSGGNAGLRYYVSVGYNSDRGSVKKESFQQYTTSANLTATYNRFTIRFNLSGNVDQKVYTPGDVELTKYAYETTRALPAYNADGSLWFYQRQVTQEGNTSIINRDFNIINDRNNTSQDIRSMGLKASVVVDYKIMDALKASLTASYSLNNTTQEVWHGEKSYYAQRLAYVTQAAQGSHLPAGGELKYQNSEHYAYVVRGQLDFNKYLDQENKHYITASTGGEVSSSQYYGLNQTYRGYLKERGKKMAEIALNTTNYTNWKATNQEALGVWTDKLTNIASAYATLSYTYNNLYTVNGNVRIDASNRFGSRANEKLAPIWSFSARWHIKDDILQHVNWIDDLSLRGSFGYQGNMLDNQSSKLILQRGALDADFQDYKSTVLSYPNPELRWEKTASYNATLDFSILKGIVSGNLNYFYKRTQDAFLSKQVSTINAVSSWVVNQGILENEGIELFLQLTPVNTLKTNRKGVRWTLSTNFGRNTNQLSGKPNEITYSGMLNGTAQIEGRPLNSFYSYKYLGLNAFNGVPIFYGSERDVYMDGRLVNLAEKYGTMELADIYQDVMTYSGTRVPTLQGGIQNSLSWGRFSASANLTYSFGSKIRLLQMYPDVNSNYATIAPQPTANVRKEFLNRWRQPGDERHTDVPGIISGSAFSNSIGNGMWWNSVQNMNAQNITFASGLWQMYDNSDLRTVSGNFLKIQSLSLRYNMPDKWSQSINIKSAYIGLSGTNIYTFAHKRLKGQDPATQDGSAPTINLSLRPTYSFSLNVSF